MNIIYSERFCNDLYDSLKMNYQHHLEKNLSGMTVCVRFIYWRGCRLAKVSSMVLILNGNSEHEGRKMALFEKKNDL